MLEPEVTSRLRELVAALKTLRAERDALERQKTEPIAIIGMACRIPGGVASPEAFWRLLEEGLDAVTEVPVERPGLAVPAGSAADPAARGLRWGAFLKDVDRFDPHFFGISPREAKAMDPQQRLLLEVAWEALENAGQVPEELVGTATGVFIGLTGNDYALLCGALDPSEHDVYTATGNGHCFPAGRLSYALGLNGPSLVVDTACSSALVAVHLACQSLRSGESSLALAGGVNVILSSATTRLLGRMGALSPDGRCKAFDAEANGFVRAEGCGVVVLKRLSDALSCGDPVLATIRGSAVNQDGRSTGLTAPNVLAQQSMLRQALENARVSPSEIGYVETHGTGTPLGDPIEIEGLAAVLGAPRDDGYPCVLGAAKTNLGHTEAASGVIGLIKAVLALRHRAIPANLHFNTLNPRISLEGTPLLIPTRTLDWSTRGNARMAGVSAFGMSGTNAHVILEEAPESALPAPAADASSVLVPLSAKTGEALSAMAQAHRSSSSDAAREAPASLGDVAYTASVRRSHHEHRLAVVASSRAELSELLGAFLRGEARPGIARGVAKGGVRAPTVFVFSGQGSQWAGMGRGLLAEERVFRAAMEECDDLVRRHAGFSLLCELRAPEETSRLAETEVAQPAIFAVQVALARLLGSWGVSPGAVVGHSVGEVAAAHVAGALSLEDAARLVVLRGRVMQQATGRGKMASVAMSADEATRSLEGHEGRLSIAALNDPGSVVLAGDGDALAEVVQRLTLRQVHCRMLRVNYAFHSPEMAAFQGELAGALSWLAPRRLALAMYSTVTQERVAGDALDAAYWAKSIREPVRFAGAIATAIADGHRDFLEVGPHPVLTGNLEQCLLDRGEEGSALPTLRRGHDERRCLLQSLGVLYAHGHAIDWKRLYPSGRCVPLPVYPWQRQRYWIEPSEAAPRPAPTLAEPRPEVTAPAFLEQLNGARAPERRRVLERWLQEAVAQALGFDDPARVDGAARLSDLGMDSMMSLELRGRLCAALDIKLSINWSFSCPTLSSLAEHVADRLGLPAEAGGAHEATRSRLHPLVVALQPAGQGTPFFCVHPAGGPVLCYADLARHLGKDRPFYAIQARGLDDDGEPDDRIEIMAARYLEALRAVQPTGPYLLGGWSLGGLVAFEMARRLVEEGSRVASLALIDSLLAVDDDPESRLREYVELASMLYPERSHSELRRLGEGELMRCLVDGVLRSNIAGFTSSVRRLFTAHEKALRSYVAPTYPGALSYFRSAEQPPRRASAEVAEPYGTLYYPISRFSSQPIELHEVPGSHWTMVREPHVQVLAARLRRCLLAADPGPNDSR
ncbi:alpha/beta fold hydrolase [Sorangium sp. So ce260]|uniref:type I polyketide synthase n=1 Tax=Sorangium sp. So ce260 TaxID=3133291 RepID=UPI003F61E286